MNIFDIFEIVITFLEGLVLLLFLNGIFSRENQGKKTAFIVISSLVYTIVITFINRFSLVSTQGIIAMIALLSTEAVLIYECRFSSALTAGITIVTMQGMLEMFIICGISVLKNDPDFVLKIISTSNTVRMIYAVFIKSVVFFVYLSTRKKLNKMNSIVDNTVFRIIAVIGFFLNVQVSRLLNTNQFMELKIGLSMMFIGFMVAIMLVIYITQKLIEKMEREKEQDLIGLKNNLLEQNMRNLSLLYDENAKKVHDFNCHINAINIMAETEQISKLKEYVSQLSTDKVYKQEFVSENEMINIIFNTKKGEIERKNIQLDLDINIGRSIGINDSDLCSLLVNILDNAIEAAAYEREKLINVIIEERDKLVYISIENNCSKNPVLENFRTSKKGSHGWGTKIIEDIAKKYDGVVEYTFNDNRLKIEVMLVKKQLNITG